MAAPRTAIWTITPSGFLAQGDVPPTMKIVVSGRAVNRNLCFLWSDIQEAVDVRRPSTTLADFASRHVSGDSRIGFSMIHGWSALWRGRPCRAQGLTGRRSLGVGSSLFWSGWVIRHGGGCARFMLQG